MSRHLERTIADWRELIRRPQWWPVLAAGFLVDWAFALVYLVGMQVTLSEQGQVNPAAVGYALAIYSGSKLLVQLLLGRMLEGLGARWGLRCALALVLVGQLSLAAMTDPTVGLPLASVIYGAGSGMFWSSLYASASYIFPYHERGRLTALTTLFTGVALACGVGLGVLLPDSFPFKGLMGLAMASTAACALPLERVSAIADGERRGARCGLPKLPTQRVALFPHHLRFWVLVLVQSTAAGALIAVFRAWGRELLGVSFHEEALYLAPAAVAGGAGLAVGGALADRYGRLPVTAMGLALSALAIGSLPSATTPPLVAFLVPLGGFGLGLASPTLSAMAMDLARWTDRDSLLACFLAVEGVGHALGPALGGLAESLSGVALALRLTGALLAMGAAWALVWWRYRLWPATSGLASLEGSGR
ncbi:hypothetical protein HRbin25_00528 [bacterium HR25]|jgi:predicted MFS family arabinose efflux permease|nr:hypothetical protein HRbin25_00528 [bacterium HR25]